MVTDQSVWRYLNVIVIWVTLHQGKLGLVQRQNRGSINMHCNFGHSRMSVYNILVQGSKTYTFSYIHLSYYNPLHGYGFACCLALVMSSFISQHDLLQLVIYIYKNHELGRPFSYSRSALQQLHLYNPIPAFQRVWECVSSQEERCQRGGREPVLFCAHDSFM